MIEEVLIMGTDVFGENNIRLPGDPLVLTTGQFQPGEAVEFCLRQENPLLSRLGAAELSYFRGEIDQAYASFTSLLGQEELNVYVAAVVGKSICELAVGKTKELFAVYRNVSRLTQQLPEDSALKKLCEYFLLYFNIILYNFGDVELPAVSVDAFDMPGSLKPMAFYAYCHYLLAQGDVGRAIGLAEGALVSSERSHPVSEIYLSLIISVGYMTRKTWDKAEYYFNHAWHLAQPDGLIMPFVELRGMLSGVLEKCLRHQEPKQYKIISDFANTYHGSWVSVHNELTGDCISDKLTAIEYNVATLAAHGISNTEISEFLGITVNSVRAHLRNIFNKLGVDSRKELIGFVI